ncbi:unnamed protein product, partial [Symbiodinium microadriaticum]
SSPSVPLVEHQLLLFVLQLLVVVFILASLCEMKPCLVFLLTLGISLADDNGKESFDLDDSYMSAHFK